MPPIHIGCSGWNYRHWKGAFYPETMRSPQWFSFYSEHFDSVEINNTFYNLPDEEVFDQWRQQAPPGFRYAVKASRYLTHMKKLRDPVEPVERLITRARRLGPHLGPILYQLPPRWRSNSERLRGVLEILPRDLVHVFEFRDVSWYNDEVGGCCWSTARRSAAMTSPARRSATWRSDRSPMFASTAQAGRTGDATATTRWRRGWSGW